MKASIVGPLGLGGLAAVAGAVAAAAAGWPFLGCFAAYSLCGGAGLIGGAILNYRAATAEELREPALAEAPPAAYRPRRVHACGG